MQIKTKTKITEIETITIDTTIVAISRTTKITTITVHQTSNKTETTQTNNHADIVTEHITSPEIVKPVLTAEDWDICLANVEHHEKIRTKGNKIGKMTETRKITIKAATQILHSNKMP